VIFGWLVADQTAGLVYTGKGVLIWMAGIGARAL
jgi:hypothetical protein